MDIEVHLEKKCKEATCKDKRFHTEKKDWLI